MVLGSLRRSTWAPINFFFFFGFGVLSSTGKSWKEKKTREVREKFFQQKTALFSITSTPLCRTSLELIGVELNRKLSWKFRFKGRSHLTESLQFYFSLSLKKIDKSSHETPSNALCSSSSAQTERDLCAASCVRSAVLLEQLNDVERRILSARCCAV